MTEPVIRSIPLHRLELSPANVRKTDAGKSAFAELKASIAALDVLENLVVRDVGPAEDLGERFAVIAGARRLAALNELSGEGVIEATHPVPCRIVTNGAADGEISLAENVVRVAMHPADQVEAFGALALAGSTVADIAARFGVSERIVEQRLRLGHAAPELLDAYRENAIDLEPPSRPSPSPPTPRARWRCGSRSRTRATGPPAGRSGACSPRTASPPAPRSPATSASTPTRRQGVRCCATSSPTSTRTASGWRTRCCLMQLATDRLKVAADELATRWKWAEARLDVEWSDLARFGRVRPTPAEPTDEENAEIERLHTRQGEFAELDDDEWTEALAEEAEGIDTRLAEIDEAIKARVVFKPEDIAIAGCIVTVGNDGTLQVVHGLVKPEDMPPDTDPATPGAAAHASGGQDDGQQAASGIQSPSISGPAMPPARPDPEAEARKEAGVGIGLADDLRAVRTALVKAHLADDFGAAFDLMLFQMGRAVFTPGHHDHALDIAVRETPDRPPLRANDDTFHESSPGEAMLEDRSSLRFEWLEIEDGAESFAALRALAPKDKKRLFAACVARTLKGQLAFEANARPETEATVARLDIEFAEHVRPGAEFFWSRVRKDRMLKVARETLGIEWAHTHRKDKKAALATAMETAFAAGDAVPLGVPKEGRAAALAWAPPGFAAFDTGTVDDGDAATPAQAEGAASGETVTESAPCAAEADSAQETSPVDAEPSDDAQSSGQQEAPAEQPEPAADAEAPEGRTPDADDAEQAAPSEPSNGAADGEAIAPTGVEAIDAINAVPIAGVGPRVIVNTVGFENGGDGDGDTSAEDAPPVPPVPGNGHDTASGDALDIPAFLRRT